MKIRLASEVTYDSIVDGKGIRCVIWTQGCPHHCEGCHNKNTHDINSGFLVDTENLVKELLSLELQSGLTLSGGEPFLQPLELLEIVQKVKYKKHWNIWCYTGFIFEDLLDNTNYFELLKVIDVLVDGKFDKDKKDGILVFKGSSNQRVIDVQKSLEQGKTILYK